MTPFREEDARLATMHGYAPVGPLALTAGDWWRLGFDLVRLMNGPAARPWTEEEAAALRLVLHLVNERGDQVERG